MFAYTVSRTDEADDGRFGQSARTYQRLHDLLSCRRIEQATALAENAGIYRLATIISQADSNSSISVLLRNQLEVWRASGALSHICPDLLRVYRLLAGAVVEEENYGSNEDAGEGGRLASTLPGLGWKRAVGVMFWYCASVSGFVDRTSTVTGALENYRIALADGCADAPVMAYEGDEDPLGADVSYPATQHGLYSLLDLLFPSSIGNSTTSTAGGENAMMEGGASYQDAEAEADAALLQEVETKVIAALRPSGYTRDALDYRASYMLLVLLESAGIARSDATYALIVRQHFISQLLAAGCWQWAVFVALQLPHPTVRADLVRDIVLRWGGESRWEDQLQDTAASAAAAGDLQCMITQQLLVPDSLIHESAAYLCGYQWHYEQQVDQLNLAGQWQIALEVTVDKIAPRAILASAGAIDQMLVLLEAFEDKIVLSQQELQSRHGQQPYMDVWAELGHVFVSFPSPSRSGARGG